MLSSARSPSPTAAEAQHDLLWAVAAVVPFTGMLTDQHLEIRWSTGLRALFGVSSRQRDLPVNPVLNEWVSAEDRFSLERACTQLVGTGAPVDVCYRVQLPAGQTKQLRVVAQLLGDATPQRVIGVLQDCTQSMLAERNLHASQDRLQTLGRLTLLGEVASGLAHELNQPLAAIATFAQAGERLLALPQPRLEKAQQVFKEVSQQALRAGDIIRRMRSLIKRRAAHFEVVAAGALIKEFLLMAEPMAYAQHVQLRTRVAIGEQRVAVDAAQIHQALMILLQNALEAVKPVNDAGAQVTFIASLEEHGLYIAVEDQGPGIDAETAAQIFRPFFSTKENGTGLGLISARNILEAHGCRLDFTNLPEHGCRFWFVLPIKSST